MNEIIEYHPDHPGDRSKARIIGHRDGPRADAAPQPLGSLIASARRLTSATIKRTGHTATAEAWQEDAWDMYDLVGEERFLAHTLASRMAQARFFVGRLPQDSTEDIEVITEGPAYDVFKTIGGRGNTFAHIVERLGINLFLPGDGYLVGVPPAPAEEPQAGGPDRISPIGQATDSLSLGGVDLSSLEWSMKSVSEIDFDASTGSVTIMDGGKEKLTYPADDLLTIRVWRPHPRYWWQADSPTRSSLPVLREIVGLTMHISAQVDSRLAGAGVFFVPETADRAVRAAAGLPEQGDDQSPFIDALMEAMITPISDRASASALVPLMPVVPDESIAKFRHMTFATPLDAEARELRDEAIRRLALGQDCPPELLLGVGSLNHWGAWLVKEDVVTTHLEPPLSLVCDALTTQFLWLVLEQSGIEDFEDYVIWYDVDHMIMRPDRSADAKDLHAAGVINDGALRDATGFDESDAPEDDPTDPAVMMSLDLVRNAPSLMQNPGLDVIVAQVRAVLEGTPIPPVPDTSPEGEPAGPVPEGGEEQHEPGEGPPATDGADGEGGPPGLAASTARVDPDPWQDTPEYAAAALEGWLSNPVNRRGRLRP